MIFLFSPPPLPSTLNYKGFFLFHYRSKKKKRKRKKGKLYDFGHPPSLLEELNRFYGVVVGNVCKSMLDEDSLGFGFGRPLAML